MGGVSRRCRAALVAGALGVAASGPCLAQSGEGTVEEVFVTATHQKTRLQDTPLAVSAFTFEQLERAGARDLRDLAAFTPGLTIGTGEGQGATPISIRGVGQNDLGIGADAPVAIYLDGVYLARSYMNLFDLVDVERIEVLRGPQGTLYGRNATGGAINVVTRQPGDVPVFEALGRVGSYRAWGVQALAMGPLGHDLSGKLAVSASGREGYTRNTLTGDDLDPEKTFALRAALRWRPSDTLDVTLNADVGYHDMPVVVHDSTDASFDPKRIALDVTPREDRDYWGLSLTVVRDLPGVQLTAITGYREAKLANVIDTDASALKAVYFEQYDKTSQVSQEVRAASTGAGPLQWLAGLYYFREEADTFSPIYLDFTAVLGLPSATSENVRGSNRTTAFAAFSQASYRVTDRLSVTGGLRWSTETKRFSFQQDFTVDIPPVFNSYPRSTQETTWSNLSPRVSLDYRPRERLLVYASYSEGFKSGGSTSVSVITSPLPNVFAPEKIKAVEAGFKGDGFGGRLRLNATAFHYDYQNLQVRTADALGFLVVRNAATATIEGVELEMTAYPARRLEITASAALLDARYDRFIDPVSLADYSGDRLNRAPKVQLSVGAQHTQALAGGSELVLRGDYAYASRIYHQPGELLAFSRDPSHLFNARAELRGPDRRWALALFGRNLANHRYIGHAFVLLGEPRSTITPPRTFGLELRFSR
jgi:iron complex outermembrane receptor protein